MYFHNKFNKEIQILIRGMKKKGASTSIDYINKNLWQVESSGYNIIKIISLLMYDELESSNDEDKVYDNSIVVAKQKNGTTITAKGETE